MQSAARFGAYALAFEESFEDDDWSRLEDFFTEDATYTVTGAAPLGGTWSGRDAVIRRLRESVDDLDRRFEARRVEAVGQPEITESTFRMTWRATYEKEGCPDLVIGGSEIAILDGERIAELRDEMDAGADEAMQAYLARHFD